MKRVDKTSCENIRSYITKDGSSIKELMHPSAHGNANQSFAEATVSPGIKTQAHRHRKSEELYHITQGSGRMALEAHAFNVEVGDTILIPPGTLHCIENISDEPLKILCCCSPPYSHDDTELLEL